MEILLSNLKKGKIKKRKRVGRGNASGHGTYATRGLKGQRSRSGGRSGLIRRSLKKALKVIPKKRGFKSFYPKMACINLEELNKNFKEGDNISFDILIEKGMIKASPSGLKILGSGKLNKKLFVKAHAFSKSAKEMIEKQGGRAQVLKS